MTFPSHRQEKIEQQQHHSEFVALSVARMKERRRLLASDVGITAEHLLDVSQSIFDSSVPASTPLRPRPSSAPPGRPRTRSVPSCTAAIYTPRHGPSLAATYVGSVATICIRIYICICTAPEDS